MITRLRIHLRDVRDCFVLPLLAAVLPVALVYGPLRRYTVRSGAYADEALANVAGRNRIDYKPAAGPGFFDEFRFGKLLAQADIFRSALGRALPRLPTESALPCTGQVGTLALSVHWGSAIGLLADFAQRAGPTHFVIAPLSREEFRIRPVRYAFARFSVWAIERATRARCIETGSAREYLASALRRGENVCILFDVPSHLVGRSRVLEAGGYRYVLPLGFAELACELAAPLIFFAHARSTASPTAPASHFFDRLDAATQPEEVLERCAQLLDQCLQANQAAWHMWQHGNELFDTVHHRVAPGEAQA